MSSVSLLCMLCMICSSCLSNSAITAGGEAEVLAWLQSQSIEVASAQNNIKSFLTSRRIPVGSQPRSLRPSNSTGERIRIALSTEDNDYECRISLGKATIGRKVVAPCGCTGSQEWVQFSELNRMRRRDPSQWVVCQTCQRRFDYGTLQMYGGLRGNIVSTLLDHTVVLRSLSTLSALVLLYLSSGLITRFLTSKILWLQYPKWSRITHLPLVLIFWIGRIVLYYIYSFYIELERGILDRLTEIETNIIEPKLPLSVNERERENEEKEREENEDE
mmetsp:Transcript_21021/g.21142  ORF Transcript_21021/g.21142 Transcript_21021/m.21142 type:complete len:275 (-) Transcript_21021:59-883(-)